MDHLNTCIERLDRRRRTRSIAMTAPEPAVTGTVSEPRLEEILTRRCPGRYSRAAGELRGHIRAPEREREQATPEVDGQPAAGRRGHTRIERPQSRERVR
jgi:hypothetical protein